MHLVLTLLRLHQHPASLLHGEREEQGALCCKENSQSSPQLLATPANSWRLQCTAGLLCSPLHPALNQRPFARRGAALWDPPVLPSQPHKARIGAAVWELLLFLMQLDFFPCFFLLRQSGSCCLHPTGRCLVGDDIGFLPAAAPSSPSPVLFFPYK